MKKKVIAGATASEIRGERTLACTQKTAGSAAAISISMIVGVSIHHCPSIDYSLRFSEVVLVSSEAASTASASKGAA